MKYGKKIGNTRSGKPILVSGKGLGYSAQDHRDAFTAHLQVAGKHQEMAEDRRKDWKRHDDLDHHHRQMAEHHQNAALDAELV